MTDDGHPQQFANRYRIQQKIGEGAHASTWRGWDERLERPVAIKILHANLADDPVFVQRFQAEAKVAASVRQSNVVDIYDFGQESGTLYIVMQFVDGEDLKSLINRSAPLSVRECRRIIGNVLDGLQAIHAAGIVHRDIKPQNVLIGTDGVARVTDFGVAEVGATSGLTGEGLTIGTVDYMAPEQAQGLPLTPAADLYATGVMLYEMLTGTLPFRGNSSRETMLQHINADVTPPSIRMPARDISPAMDAVIGQSLSKDPGRRFASARAMKQAIGQSFVPANSTTSQPTTVVRTPSPAYSAPPAAAAPQTQAYYPPATDAGEEGAGLNGAFKAILMLLLIGVIGIGIWGAFQLVDPDRFDFNLPLFGSDATETPTVTPAPTDEPTAPPVEVEQPIEPDVPAPTDVPVQPTTPPEIVPPTEIPTEIPTEVPEPTSPPSETEPPPIEPIEPDGAVEDSEFTSAGYDDRYQIRRFYVEDAS